MGEKSNMADPTLPESNWPSVLIDIRLLIHLDKKSKSVNRIIFVYGLKRHPFSDNLLELYQRWSICCDFHQLVKKVVGLSC